MARFIPSDVSPDFARTRPGDNRNMDLRRAFMARVDAVPIRATSILNGAFAWQGMQYVRDMASGRGKLLPLDDARYGTTDWTRVDTVLAPMV